MDETVAYTYVEHKESKLPAFKITDGKYVGAVWNYKNVKLPLYGDDGGLIDLEEAEQLVLTFEYDVLYNPTDEIVDGGEFASAIGDILLTIIDESIENDQIEFNRENRNNDTEQLDTQ